jgi:hypothetical protein
MILRNLSSEEVCIVAGWIAITRSLAKVFFATEITEEMSFKSFFSHCPDVLCQERSLCALWLIVLLMQEV